LQRQCKDAKMRLVERPASASGSIGNKQRGQVLRIFVCTQKLLK